jgi:hypothetical protein
LEKKLCMGKKKRFTKKGKPYSDVFIEFFILVLLIPTMFSLSLLVGFGYLFAFVGSVYRKTIFRKKFVARLIILGSLLTYIAGAILKYGFGQDDIIAFVMIIMIGIVVWFYGFRLKNKGRKGK